MHTRCDPPARLFEIAGAQSGVISSDQLRCCAFPLRSAERLVAQQHWRRLATGIYAVSREEPPWLGLAWAGVLLGGPQARLGLAAAGHLWGLVGESPQEITVFVPKGRDIVDHDRWVFAREAAGTRDSRSPGSPSRTTIEDTVIDLCRGSAEGRVQDLVMKAVQSRRTTAKRILDRVDQRTRVSHRAYLHDLLADVAEGAQSALELRYQKDVERAHGLPRGVRQARAGRGKAYRDVRYDKYATIVELDGLLHAMEKLRDARRDNAALVDGEVTLRYGWPDVSERPCQVAWEVAAILVRRGWLGSPTRCRNCEGASDTDLRFP